MQRGLEVSLGRLALSRAPAMFPLGYRSENSGVQLLLLCHSKQHRLHTAVMVKRGGNMCMNHQELPMDLLALDLFGLELTCASAR
jgi:hypothetical protein